MRGDADTAPHLARGPRVVWGDMDFLIVLGALVFLMVL